MTLDFKPKINFNINQIEHQQGDLSKGEYIFTHTFTYTLDGKENKVKTTLVYQNCQNLVDIESFKKKLLPTIKKTVEIAVSYGFGDKATKVNMALEEKKLTRTGREEHVSKFGKKKDKDSIQFENMNSLLKNKVKKIKAQSKSRSGQQKIRYQKRLALIKNVKNITKDSKPQTKPFIPPKPIDSPKPLEIKEIPNFSKYFGEPKSLKEAIQNEFSEATQIDTNSWNNVKQFAKTGNDLFVDGIVSRDANERTQFLKKAYLCFTWAHQLNPNNKQILQKLVSICAYLNDDKGIKYWCSLRHPGNAEHQKQFYLNSLYLGININQIIEKNFTFKEPLTKENWKDTKFFENIADDFIKRATNPYYKTFFKGNYDKDHLDSAILFLLMAIKIDKNNTSALKKLVKVYTEFGDIQAAEYFQGLLRKIV